MLSPGRFENFDNDAVYSAALTRAEHEATHNFIVDFGKGEASIAFDLNEEAISELFEAPTSAEKPIRWINIWAPDCQQALTRHIGAHYKFSPRLLEVICSKPIMKPFDNPADSHRDRFLARLFPKHDIELGTNVLHKFHNHNGKMDHIGHYTIANQMVNYQSTDFGDHFTCIGANWMHQLPKSAHDGVDFTQERSQRRLFSWLVICDDQTVISIHEDPGPSKNPEITRAMRGNTLSVLSQLSSSPQAKNLRSDPISMQSVRQMLIIDKPNDNVGVEGASMLFYYLFDDWRSTYGLIAAYHRRLDDLSAAILSDMTKNVEQTPNIEIIPRLHIIGREMRGMSHLYENYNSIIDRILKSADPHIQTSDHSTEVTITSAGNGGVVLTRSARQRFERLGDRIRLLVLSELTEYLAEKDALVSTYFNINAQKDSEATARLTRSATLLAKLSVLFLPVSLMTAYFSVQIDDLAGIYTAKTYWVAFAVIMSISFLGLFFFSRLLMWTSETLDIQVRNVGTKVKGKWYRRRGKVVDEE